MITVIEKFGDGIERRIELDEGGTVCIQLEDHSLFVGELKKLKKSGCGFACSTKAAAGSTTRTTSCDSANSMRRIGTSSPPLG
jgi:hypothetical protein